MGRNDGLITLQNKSNELAALKKPLPFIAQ
jgi:hypothetical protein